MSIKSRFVLNLNLHIFLYYFVLLKLDMKGKKLSVTFKCADGEQKCDKSNLAMSDFFSLKLPGFDRFSNQYVFGKGHSI